MARVVQRSFFTGYKEQTYSARAVVFEGRYEVGCWTEVARQFDLEARHLGEEFYVGPFSGCDKDRQEEVLAYVEHRAAELRRDEDLAF